MTTIGPIRLKTELPTDIEGVRRLLLLAAPRLEPRQPGITQQLAVVDLSQPMQVLGPGGEAMTVRFEPSAGGTAVTLCAGRVVDRPVVRDGAVVPAPVMQLGLTFDHRVIDGAAAADVLSDLHDTMEAFDDSTAGAAGTRAAGPGPDARGADRDPRPVGGLEPSTR